MGNLFIFLFVGVVVILVYHFITVTTGSQNEQPVGSQDNQPVGSQNEQPVGSSVHKSFISNKVLQKEVSLVVIIVSCLFIGFGFHSGYFQAFRDWGFENCIQSLATVLMSVGLGCAALCFFTGAIKWTYKPKLSRMSGKFVSAILLMVLGTHLWRFGLWERLGLIVSIVYMNIVDFSDEPELDSLEIVISILQSFFLGCFILGSII